LLLFFMYDGILQDLAIERDDLDNIFRTLFDEREAVRLRLCLRITFVIEQNQKSKRDGSSIRVQALGQSINFVPFPYCQDRSTYTLPFEDFIKWVVGDLIQAFDKLVRYFAAVRYKVKEVLESPSQILQTVNQLYWQC
jgi:hypothetical protein